MNSKGNAHDHCSRPRNTLCKFKARESGSALPRRQLRKPTARCSCLLTTVTAVLCPLPLPQRKQHSRPAAGKTCPASAEIFGSFAQSLVKIFSFKG